MICSGRIEEQRAHVQWIDLIGQKPCRETEVSMLPNSSILGSLTVSAWHMQTRTILFHILAYLRHCLRCQDPNKSGRLDSVQALMKMHLDSCSSIRHKIRTFPAGRLRLPLTTGIRIIGERKLCFLAKQAWMGKNTEQKLV